MSNRKLRFITISEIDGRPNSIYVTDEMANHIGIIQRDPFGFYGFRAYHYDRLLTVQELDELTDKLATLNNSWIQRIDELLKSDELPHELDITIY